MTLNIRTSLRRRSRAVLAVVQTAVLVGASLVPLFTLSSVHAANAQITDRKITLGGVGLQASPNATKAGQTGVTYNVAFSMPTTGNVGGVVVDFCSNSPVITFTCNAPTGFDLSTATLSSQGGALTGFSKDGASSAHTFIISKATATSVGGAANFDIAGVTNPTQVCNATTSAICTFYARILTYSSGTGAAGYTDTTPGTYVDGGGIAMSTANQLTISARVQEVLHFCVGTVKSAATNCTSLTGTAIDLGVVDSTAIKTDSSGKFIVRSNAVNGTVVAYYAEKDNGSGQLKVPGSTCAGTLTDQCFNSLATGTTGTNIVIGTEGFGMNAISDAQNGLANGTTNNMIVDAVYNSATNTGNYAWDDTNTDILASSATVASPVKVLDNELFDLTFAVTAGATTPTGAYTVTQTFIATATY